MRLKKRLGVVVVGAGRIATGAHLPAWAGERRAHIAGVVDTRPGVARAVAKRWGIPRWSNDLEELLLPGVDLVDICTPAFAHRAPLLTALRAGKHVLIEKPAG